MHLFMAYIYILLYNLFLHVFILIILPMRKLLDKLFNFFSIIQYICDKTDNLAQ